jgi:hypothetical protein
VAQPVAKLCIADGLNPGRMNPNPMTGSGAQSAQPLLPPDQPGAQPQGQTGQVAAPVQGPQNAMQNAPQTGMQNGGGSFGQSNQRPGEEAGHGKCPISGYFTTHQKWS